MSKETLMKKQDNQDKVQEVVPQHGAMLDLRHLYFARLQGFHPWTNIFVPRNDYGRLLLP